jgi:hypothetical protein
MTVDRELVALAVLNGQISSDHLTLKEANEIGLRLVNTIIQKELDAAVARGSCSVFSGYKNPSIH